MTVWKREVEAPEVRDQGYLRLLQTRSPGETFRGEQSAFKAQGGEVLQRGKARVGFGGAEWRGDPGRRGQSEPWAGGEVWTCPAILLHPPAVSTLLTLLPPPVLKCRQFTVAGKHLTVLKGEQTCGRRAWVAAGELTGWQWFWASWWGWAGQRSGYPELGWLPSPVLNSSSQEEISIWDIRILPNFNASYLPVMPDGSVLLVDNVW